MLRSPLSCQVQLQFHTCDGRCNKWLTISEHMDEAQAEHRLKEWCMRGLEIPDTPGGKIEHMADKSRRYTLDELKSVEVLDEMADGIV